MRFLVPLYLSVPLTVGMIKSSVEGPSVIVSINEVTRYREPNYPPVMEDHSVIIQVRKVDPFTPILTFSCLVFL